MLDLSYIAKRLDESRRGVKRPKFVGLSKRKLKCDRCGKPNLSKSFIFEMPDGSTSHLGSDCAAKLRNDRAEYEAVDDDMIKKYPQFEEEIKYFRDRDPSGNLKYLRWELSILDSGQALHPEIADVVDLFNRLNQRLTNKDIYSYKPSDFTDLRDKLFEISGSVLEKQEKTLKYKEKPPSVDEAPTIYDGQRFTAAHIRTKKASTFYGRGTKWCITMGMQNFWEDYEGKNEIFVFIMDRDVINDIEKGKVKPQDANPLYKIAAQVKRDEDDRVYDIVFWNGLDQIVRYADVKEYMGDEFEKMIDAIVPIAKKWPKSPIARLGTGKASKEECSKIFEETKEYKSDQVKNSIFYMLASSSCANSDEISYILKYSIVRREYLDGIKPKIKDMTEDEFKSWKKEVRIPFHATRESAVNAIDEEESAVNKTIRSALRNKNMSSKDILSLVGKKSYIDSIIAATVRCSPENETIIKKLIKNSPTKIEQEKKNISVWSTAKYNIATRYDLPKKIANELANDSDPIIVSTVISSNENISPRIINSIIENSTDSSMVQAAIKHKSSDIKYIVGRVEKCIGRGSESNYIDLSVCSAAICGLIRKTKSPSGPNVAKSIIDRINKIENHDTRSSFLRIMAQCDTDKIGIENWQKLMSNPTESVRAAAAGNQMNPYIDPVVNDTDSVKMSLISRYNFGPIYKEKVTRSWAMLKSGSEELKKYVGNVFKELAKSQDYGVRSSLADQFRSGVPSFLNEQDAVEVLKAITIPFEVESEYFSNEIREKAERLLKNITIKESIEPDEESSRVDSKEEMEKALRRMVRERIDRPEPKFAPKRMLDLLAKVNHAEQNGEAYKYESTESNIISAAIKRNLVTKSTRYGWQDRIELTEAGHDLLMHRI